MKITTRDDGLRGDPMDAANFTGPVSAHPVHVGTEPTTVRVSVVHFPPGVRNHWHQHSGGQVLHVVDGEGFAQGRGEPPQRIAAGDTVSTAPGEEHWHGAGPGASMAHLAFTLGETTWLEPSELDLT